MNFLTGVHTDVGIKKSTNQDSVLIQEADTDCGKVIFAMVCDGMGGLSKGELASAIVVKRMSEWFENELPSLIYGNFTEEELRKSWENIVFSANRTIQDYGSKNHVSLGTTMVSLLIFNNKYYVMNIGDSRAYRIKDSLFQITKDQTFVQREMDAGRMTPDEARRHPQRNVLLQCIGASPYITPDFFTGTVEKEDVYMLCSDGFRHIITEEEFWNGLNPSVLISEEAIKQNLEYFTELNKSRREEDNISSVAIKTY